MQRRVWTGVSVDQHTQSFSTAVAVSVDGRLTVTVIKVGPWVTRSVVSNGL